MSTYYDGLFNIPRTLQLLISSVLLVDFIIVTIIEMRKLWHKEVKQLAPKSHSQDSGSDSLALFLTTLWVRGRHESWRALGSLKLRAEVRVESVCDLLAQDSRAQL